MPKGSSGYALDPDGTPHDAVIFYKDLKQADEGAV